MRETTQLQIRCRLRATYLQTRSAFAAALMQKRMRARTRASNRSASLESIKAGGIRRGRKRVGVMFFLLRVAFWLTLVCVLVPGTKSSAPDAQFDAGQAMTVASAAMSDARGFCERQPQACSAGSRVASAIGHKAEDGARTLYQLISSKVADKPAEKTAGKAAQKHVDEIAEKLAELQRSIPVAARGTLTQSDLQPAWQGPAPMPRRDPRTRAGV
jgi:Family of unknown function (DUF5330)